MAMDLSALGEDGLDEESISQLLENAENRLRIAQHQSKQNLGDAHPTFPTLRASVLPKPYVSNDKYVARVDSHRLLARGERGSASGIRRVEDPVTLQKMQLKSKKATAGSDWFNLPRTNLTPNLKRDLQLLQMRSVLDGKRHYKKDNTRSGIPEFSQAGTVIEGPAEYFSARVKRKHRKETLADEILSSERSTGRFKSKYGDIQATKTGGKKGHLKAMQTKRSRPIK